MKIRKSSSKRRERGQSLVETGLMVTVILILVFSIFEIGWMMYTYVVMSDAANEGVRYAIVHSGADVSGTTARVQAFAGTSLHDVSAMTVAVSDPDTGYTPPRRVRVTVSYTYVPWLSNFMPNPPLMSTYAEGRMVQ